MARLFVALLFSTLAVGRVLSMPQPLGKTAKSPCSAIELTRPQAADLVHWNSEPRHMLVVSGLNLRALRQKLETQIGGGGGGGPGCKALGNPIGRTRDTATVKALMDEHGLSPTVKYWNDTESAWIICILDDLGTPLAFLFSEFGVKTLCQFESLMLEVSCQHVPRHCYTVSLHKSNKPEFHKKQFRRHALNTQRGGGVAMSLEQRSPRPQSGGTPAPVVVGMVVGVVGLVVLVLVLALCGGGADTYDPGKGSSKRMSARSEVAEQPLPEDTIPTSKELKTNGTTASSAAAPAVAAVTTSNEREKSMSHSAEHLSISSLKEDSDRAGTLSAARSFDPLPEVPKLELAEGGSKEKSGEDDNDDDDDDDPYAEVLVDNVDRMADSESDGERGSNGDGDGDGSSPKKPPGGVSPAPPYGKVSRHTKPPAEAKQEEADSDSYAEVRDVIRRGPMFSSRERSQTDPPAPAGLGVPRERRALTESATHMPLPDIPAADGGMHPVIVEESEMYDSIPESGTKNASPASSHSVAGKRKERLYESVDEMAEKDLYESVPDNFPKVNSPVRPQPVSTPALSPTKRVSEAPLPPSSPIPSKNELHKKKGLEKTLSAAAQQEEKRRFSFFGRKKPGSVTKTKKGEQPESPTALVSSISPQHKSPPLPNIPIPPPPNEDDDEDTYDKVTPSLIGAESNEIFQQLLANKAKSTSLPRICGAGGRPNLPLPRLPEDSGSATVQHKRVIEGSRGPDEYDTVNVSAEQILDEPNYDTVKVEDIFMLPVAGGGADPPYDKIDKQELQEFREREKQSRENLKSMSSEPNDSNLSGGYSKVRGETPEGELDQSGLPPDHDEEGYAVVPEEIRLRKRAMSASQGVRRDLSPDSVAAGYHVIGHDDTIREARSHTVSVSPKKSASGNASRENVEDQYACIDLGAKKKQRELEEVLRLQEELRAYSEEPHSTSPVPPPLPPALSPDDMEEYKQPPIPSQSEGMHELMGDGLKVSQSDTADPPYARVKSKSDNPYAEVSRPYAEVDVSSFQNQSKAGAGGSTDDSLDEAMGYDIVGGTLGVKTKIAQKDKPYDTIENVVSGQIHESGGVSEDTLDEALGYDVDGTVGVKAKLAGKKVKPYDTIADVKVDMPSQLEQDMPILETAESAAVNIYDTLFPEDEEEDARYDVIDKPRNTPRSMV